jgi:hypothetical protein
MKRHTEVLRFVVDMPSGACFDFPLLKDDVSAIVQDAVLSNLEGNTYDHGKVSTSMSIMPGKGGGIFNDFFYFLGE